MAEIDNEILPGSAESSAEDALAASDAVLDLDAGGEPILVEEPPPPLGRSLALDTATGQLLTGGHGPVEVYGEANLRFWMDKAMHTVAGAHPVHPPGYGMDRPLVDYLAEPESAGGELIEDLTEALLFHPLIAEITDVTAEVREDIANAWNVLEIGFTYVLSDETEGEFETVVGP